MLKLIRWIGKFLVFILVILLIAGIVYFKKDIQPEKLIAKYATADSRFMNLMGMNVHYRDEGNMNDSVPLILIHGTASSLLTWDSSVQILKKDQRIIRFDLPGYALTGPNPEKNYSFDFYTRFIDSFVNRLHIAHFFLAGNSLGGGIAWHYTLAHKEKVAGLVLVDASGYVGNSKPSGALGFKLAQIPVINQLLKWITPRAIVKKSLEDVYGDDSKITETLVDQYYELLLRTGNRQALLDRMKTGFGTCESYRIKEIKSPTLIIWGDKDRLIPVACAYLFQKDIPGSEVEILKGIGHVPMEEEPTRFAQIILPFISDVKKPKAKAGMVF